MSELENILAFIFLFNWRIIWNLERQQIPCNEDWHLLFFPVSSTHRQTIHYSPARSQARSSCGSPCSLEGGLMTASGPPGATPSGTTTRMPIWAWQVYVRPVSSRVMTSFCRQRSSPVRLRCRIVPLKVISALTYVIRSNGSVFTFHTEHSSYGQPTLKLTLHPDVEGRLIALRSLAALYLGPSVRLCEIWLH